MVIAVFIMVPPDRRFPPLAVSMLRMPPADQAAGLIISPVDQTMDPLVAAELRHTRNALSSVIGSRPVTKPPRQVRR